MQLDCPHCSAKVLQSRNHEGPNFCPACQKLFRLLPEREVPHWMFGVLVVLVGNWQVILYAVI
jgi:hypothetical protein